LAAASGRAAPAKPSSRLIAAASKIGFRSCARSWKRSVVRGPSGARREIDRRSWRSSDTPTSESRRCSTGWPIRPATTLHSSPTKPFATLDPTLRRVFLAPGHYVRVADTVGFITELPSELLNAFRATLEELEGAELLVHVIDASNPDWLRQRRSVETILRELGVDAKPTILAFNKIDASDPQFELPPDAIALSARTGAGIEALRARIAELLLARTAP